MKTHRLRAQLSSLFPEQSSAVHESSFFAGAGRPQFARVKTQFLGSCTELERLLGRCESQWSPLRCAQHGDLRGESVLVDAFEHCWVLDFGNSPSSFWLADLLQLLNAVWHEYASVTIVVDAAKSDEALSDSDHVLKWCTAYPAQPESLGESASPALRAIRTLLCCAVDLTAALPALRAAFVRDHFLREEDFCGAR